MNFSAILDISSFFIGMIINLLLIALICYYFKRKYENLEIAQNEQAKVLYQLLQQNTQPKVININDLLKKDLEPKNYQIPELESDSGSDTDSDEETDNDSVGLDDLNELDMNDVKTETVIERVDRVEINEIKTIKLIVDEPTSIEEVNVNLKLDLDIEVDAALEVDIDKDEKEKEKEEKDYSKMTIKQLKDVLSTKGININSNKMKKNEMIELIEKSSTTINE